jgi:hypothetical protein
MCWRLAAGQIEGKGRCVSHVSHETMSELYMRAMFAEQKTGKRSEHCVASSEQELGQSDWITIFPFSRC